MSDVRLFDISSGQPREVSGSSFEIEKDLQTLIEENLEIFFATRFLATEYSTGEKHGGRIDTLGLDENNSPVIFEYKRSRNENVITQGLYYLDWLLDHKSEFEVLAREALGEDSEVEWSAPRLVCIAGGYSKFDIHATNQINRNIELIRYEVYEGNHILFDLINSVAENIGSQAKEILKQQPTASENLAKAPEKLRQLWQEAEDYIFNLGEDVNKVELKKVAAFRTIKNFACLYVLPAKEVLRITLSLDPDSIVLEEGFSRNMQGTGHWGTGDLQLEIKSKRDLEKAKSLIEQAYREAS